MVISGAVERHPEKVQKLVYLDAFIPEHGQCVLDLLPPGIGEHFRSIASQAGEGWRLPAGDGHLDLWGLAPGPAREFVREKLCDFNLNCFTEPIVLRERQLARASGCFVACVAPGYPAGPFFAPFADKARSMGWPVFDVDCGHDCHAERPEIVADILGTAARKGQ